MAVTISDIRILIQDAKGPKEYLPDSHYTAIIALEPVNVFRAAAIASRAIASKFAAQVDTTADKISIKRQQKFDHFMKLADKLDSQADKGTSGVGGVGGPALTGVSISEMEDIRDDTDRPRNRFRKGIHDNPGSDTDSDEEHNCF